MLIEGLRSVPLMFPFFISLALLICLIIYKRTEFHWAIVPARLFREYKWCLVGMLLGGKILSALSLIPYAKLQAWNFKEYIMHIGFVYYGAIVGTIITVIICSRFNLQESLKVTDTLARLIPIGQAIGRFGCFFNGCCYGKEYNGPLAVTYRVQNEYKLVFPTWFIESFVCLSLGVFFLRKRDLSLGMYTYLYAVIYGVFRFFIEFMRGDIIRGFFGGLSTSQWISIAFVIFGVVGLVIKNKEE